MSITLDLIGTVLGSVAALCTTAAFVPQAVKVIREQETKAISASMYGVFTTGVALWFVYGLLIGSAPVMAANAVTFLLAMTILVMKLRYG